MSRCLWIFGAYSYRLSRRHSTVLLIAFLIGTVTAILQLYAYKHQVLPHTPTKVGDFDYKPGNFLEGQQPNDSRSYCQFNYGLPYRLHWPSVTVYSSPELGGTGPYRVIYNAITGTAYANYSKFNAVTYATQATPEYVYHVVEIARYWEGPISLAIFTPGYDLDIAMQILKHLCHCFPGMAKVSVHLFYMKRFIPTIRSREEMIETTEMPQTTAANVTAKEILRQKQENYRNLDNKTRAKYIEMVRQKKLDMMMKSMPKKKTGASNVIFKDCSGAEGSIPTFRKEFNLIYPINVGRNVARNASRTNYFIVSDIEMVPSDGLAPKFLTMVRKLMGDKKRNEGCVFAKTIFVVPLFEVEKGENIPRDKDALLSLVTANRAVYFHQKVCAHCQRFPGLQSWLNRPSPTVVEPMLIAKREYPYHRWEPLYFGTHKEPWYNEILSWDGRQDKMTQMLELCLQQYRMVVLDGAFLCHAAAPAKPRRPRRANSNIKRYMSLIASLKRRYPFRQECRLLWGC